MLANFQVGMWWAHASGPRLHKSKKLFTIIVLVRKRSQKNLLSYTQTQKFKIFLKRKGQDWLNFVNAMGQVASKEFNDGLLVNPFF